MAANSDIRFLELQQIWEKSQRFSWDYVQRDVTHGQIPTISSSPTPGIKNHLALPCYNQANAVYRGQLTENQSVVISTINPATENVIYTGADGTVLDNFQRSMTGGGTQFAPAINTVGNIAEHGAP